jgi:hypothetical protein
MARNLTAKYGRRVNRHSVHRDKKNDYTRKRKHKRRYR